jgi:hypothetical protein
MDIRYILSLLILLSLAGIAAAVPPLPDEFAGSVALDGRSAPAGTTITAKINWNERGSTVVTAPGTYGPLDSPGVLAVRATEDDLQHSATPIITFWVNGHKADQEVKFTGGTVRHLDLSAVTGGAEEPVPVASGSKSFEIGGVEVTETDTEQRVVIDNKAVLGGIATNETAITLNDAGGWEEVVIFTKEKPTGDAQITGTVQSVHARSKPVTTESGWAQIDLEMSRHPGSTAQLETTVYQKPGDDEKKEFETVTYQMTGENIASFAYVLNIQKSNIANEGDGGVIKAATIRMAASPEWVDNMGGKEKVVILRRADDGITTTLETRYVGSDAAGNYIFEAVSPDGLSAFALVATKPKPLDNGSSSDTPTSSSGRSPRDPGSQIVYDPDATDVYIGSAPLVTSPDGVVLDSVTVRSDDEKGTVMVPKGTTALDSAGNALSEVTCTKVATAEIPAIPPGTTVAVALSCGPAGATFDPPVLLSYTLSAEEWARFSEGATPKVMWYNSDTGKWEDVPATVNSSKQTVTAEISHFSIYALVWTSPETATPAPQDTSTPDQEPGDAFPTWVLAIVVVLIVAVVAFFVMKKK